jgi:hypothetical protein
VDDIIFPISDDQIIHALDAAIEKSHDASGRKAYAAVILAALGSIPWVGAVLNAGAAFALDDRESDIKADSLRTQWLKEHQRKLLELKATLEDVCNRFESLGDTIDERIQSEEYLALVRRAFRTWDDADTTEKKRYVANLITNAAGTRLCSDDIIRLFIDWLKLYHEAHFGIVREIYKDPGLTRLDMWTSIYGERFAENSAEADLFKMLIHDLSTGHVIRQERAVDSQGNLIQRPRAKALKTYGAKVYKSAFDDKEPYELTELGKQFVHYTMNEAVTRLNS